MHSDVTQALQCLRIGEPETFKNLTMHPLLDGLSGSPDYLLLEQAVQDGLVQVTEVSEVGAVNSLKVTNCAEKPVLIVDGEELVGAKQNRVVNLTILVPEQETIIIPASCVGQGRWRDVLPEFRVLRQSMPADMWTRKAMQVSSYRERTGEPRSDQSALWDELDRKRMTVDVDSPTGAMSDIYERYEVTLADYERAFRPAEGQVGALFSINGRIAGVDVFDYAHTLSRFFPKLVRSYALDAISFFQVDFVPVFAQTVQQFIERVGSADSQTFPAVGEGEDVRFRGAGIVGSALVARGRVMHLCAFSQPDDGGKGFRDLFTRLSRASSRRERLL
ncbi:MAG: ARPP-1 family domain-containing protein [Armatimonadota bacterium]